MNKVLSCLGLAKKAGKLSVGTASTLDEIKNKKALLVILASDASDNTKKLITDKAKFRSIPYQELDCTCSEMGDALGKTACACAAITDKSFVKMFEQAKNKSGGNTIWQ
ncbi:MAG: ribosomal L7Ae/L30e/S12e/Gadd45 family protein [Clostridia bacterium]